MLGTYTTEETRSKEACGRAAWASLTVVLGPHPRGQNQPLAVAHSETATKRQIQTLQPCSHRKTHAKHVKLAARRPCASLMWPVLASEFDMLDPCSIWGQTGTPSGGAPRHLALTGGPTQVPELVPEDWTPLRGLGEAGAGQGGHEPSLLSALCRPTWVLEEPHGGVTTR